MARYWVVLNEEERQKVRQWHDWLLAEKQKGERARLRRCDTVSEVLFQTGFHRLCKTLPRLEVFAIEGLGLVAGLLSWCETSNEQELAERLGQKRTGSEQPLFSELRFQRLMAIDDSEEFYKAMRRAIVQVDKTCEPVMLSDSVLHWFSQNKHPEHYLGQRQWQYIQAKNYFKQIL